MKNIFLILSLLITSELVYSQNISFAKWYDFGAAETGYCVQQTPDSGYVACGFQGLGAFSSKMVVMKTDKNGVLQWGKLFGDGSNDQYAYHIINCSAGGYAVVGYRSGPGFVEDIYVLRLNNAGDTIWTRQYGTPLVEEGNGIVETADKGFAVSFWDENDSTGILKIDSAGNFQWWKHYYLFGGANFRNIALTTSGDFIMAGVAIIPAGNYQGFVMRANSIGNLIWTKSYGNPSRWSDLYEVQETSDGNIIAGGMMSPSTLWGTYVLKLNAIGDTIWTKYRPPLYDDEMTSIEQCNDGGYIVAGTTYNPTTSDGNMYIEKLDQYGDTIWTKQFGGANTDYGHYVRQTNDNGFILVGMTNNWDPSGAGIYLVKTDSTGMLVTGINELSANNFDLSIYPNPSTGVIYFKFDLQSKYTLEVINETGQVMLSKEFFEKNSNVEKTIDISFLQSGIYFLKIQGERSSVVKKVVKID